MDALSEFLSMRVGGTRWLFVNANWPNRCPPSAWDEDLAGTMWLTMTLHEDARIRGVVLEPRSTLRSEPMRACLERRLYALPMPMPQGESVEFWDTTGSGPSRALWDDAGESIATARRSPHQHFPRHDEADAGIEVRAGSEACASLVGRLG